MKVKNNKHKAYFYASYEWNGRVAATAYIIYDPEGNVVDQDVGHVLTTDNNTAEWLALNSLLKALRKWRIREVVIYGDNRGVIYLAKKAGQNKGEVLCKMSEIIKDEKRNFRSISFKWINRKMNVIADKLSRSAQKPEKMREIKDIGINNEHRKKNKNNTYTILPYQFDFKFKYKESKRKIVQR